jgi:thioredoxin-like negative regulator of GroEL
MQELNDQNFLSTIEKEPICLVDFYASWCGSCRMAAPMFQRVSLEAKIPIYKLEVEKNPQIKDMLTLEGLPSIGLFKQGEPLGLINTAKEEAFRDFLKQHQLLP